MLSQSNRLRLKKDFERVFKEGRSFHSDAIGIKTVPNNLNVLRIGIIVGTKVSKSAVVRNTLKRRIREAVRKELPRLRKGFDLVIITRPQIKNMDFQEINEILVFLFKKLRIIKPGC